ncbi:MerR family transcriptional regulator, partial [Mycolicibacterium goodii]|uniref:MerR family transcriptional regulator n=1 Tax=Mycolicibacterium goodii TaxID=134601 RepID=UPI000C25D1FB
YRWDELAQISGVNARNIRAYRERGLLDPPRRVGRSAYYDDVHAAQLKVITQLLNKGFSSAHIAEFFSSVRHGQDLTEVLGIERAQLAAHRSPVAVEVQVPDADVRTLVEVGLAEVVEGAFVLTDPALSASAADSADQRTLIQTAARIARLTADTVDDLAEQAADVLAQDALGDPAGDMAANITPAVVARTFNRSFHRAFRRALQRRAS